MTTIHEAMRIVDRWLAEGSDGFVAWPGDIRENDRFYNIRYGTPEGDFPDGGSYAMVDKRTGELVLIPIRPRDHVLDDFRPIADRGRSGSVHSAR